jgi:predicted ATP-grasp superfamily ATP-dependent carboligase
VQEYLPGAAKGCSVLAQNGKIIRKICHKRIREFPVSGGPSTCCEAIRDPLIEEYAARLAEAASLTGLSMFEFKDNASAEPRLLEVNPRIWGSYPLTRIAKSGFSYAWYVLSHNAGNPDSPLPCPPETDYRPRRMLFFPSDLASARGYLRVGKSSLARGAVFDLLKPAVKDGLFEWGDPRPALRYWRSLLKREKNTFPKLM